MAIKITGEGKVENLRTWDSLRCECCGQEILIPPSMSDRVVCALCGRANYKSQFVPITKKLWISKQENFKNHPEHCRFNCVSHYRRAVQFRRAIFRLYDKQGYINWPQAVALIIAAHIDAKNGVIKLLEGTTNISFFRPTPKFMNTLEWLEHEQTTNFRQDTPTDDQISKEILALLSDMQLKRCRGNQSRSDTLILMLDAIILRFCPNPYVHLLRDALRLRSAEYRKSNFEGKSAKRKAWHQLLKVKRGSEASCKRIWKHLFNENPPSLKESYYPRAIGKEHDTISDEWWIKVARQQGMTS
jgi:hypothetical protein